MTTCLQQVIEADDVRLYVDIRVVNAVADTRLGGKVDHNIKVILLEKGFDEDFITDGAFDEHMLDRGCGRSGIDLLQTPFLKADLVVIVHVIERNDGTGGKGLEETDYKICTDETGGAGYKDAFVI